jgi:hypothetical protein
LKTRLRTLGPVRSWRHQLRTSARTPRTRIWTTKHGHSAQHLIQKLTSQPTAVVRGCPRQIQASLHRPSSRFFSADSQRSRTMLRCLRARVLKEWGHGGWPGLSLGTSALEMPECEHQPPKYTGPSKEEVLALRKEFLSPGAPAQAQFLTLSVHVHASERTPFSLAFSHRNPVQRPLRIQSLP